MKVAFFHNIIAPYRIPLFEKLSKKLDLKVYFGKASSSKRKWKINNPLKFKYEILKNFGEFYLFSTINLTLIFKLIKGKYNFFIGADANLFGTQISFIIAKILRKPFILWIVERDYSLIEKRPTIFKIVKTTSIIVSKHADACVVPGIDAKRRLMRIGIQENKIHISPNATPIPIIREAYEKTNQNLREKLGIPQNYKIFLSLSYLRKEKGIQHLIEAYKWFKQDREDIALIIIGDGPYRETLEKLSYGIPDIHFPGYISEIEEKANYYKTADVFILPSLKDTWGLTINEAMICETPIITTHDVGARELIRDNGYVIPSRDPFVLHKSMVNILENNLKNMGLKSWKYIQDYSIEKEAQGFIEAIKGVGL